MKDQAAKRKKPRDLNLLAARIVEEATGSIAPPLEDTRLPEKNPYAVELGRLGGLRGCVMRAKRLTPEQRSEIARKAAKARWQKKKS